MKKSSRNTIIFFSSSDHKWKSCNILEKNLLSIYRNIYGRTAEYIDLENPKWPKHFSNKKQATKIVLITHKIDPIIFYKLNRLGYSNPQVKVRWHVFGNFINLFFQNNTLETFAKKFQIEFVTASEAFANKIKSNLKISDYPVLVLPFSVENSTFKPKNLKKSKTLVNLPDQSKVICVAGRLSFQKNIFYIVSVFSKLAREEKNVHLVACGSFDDIGIPEIGLSFIRNSYCANTMRIIANLPKSIRDRIHFLGEVSQSDLADIFCFSDVYVNLSTYFLEDFGVAPIQALMCGTPAVLTSWGGFADHGRNCPSSVSLVPVGLRKGSIWIDEGTLLVSIKRILKRGNSPRGQIGLEARRFYSIGNIENKLLELESKNSGTPPLFRGLNKKQTNQLFPKPNRVLRSVLLSGSLLTEAKTFVVRPNRPILKSVSLSDNWNSFLEEVRGRWFLRQLAKAPLNSFWFQTKDYDDVLDSISLFDLVGHRFIFSFSEPLLCNDGPLQIKLFFQKYPKPIKGLKGPIFLDLCLKSQIKIPLSWKPKIGFYLSRGTLSRKLRRPKLLIFAPKEAFPLSRSVKEVIKSSIKNKSEVYFLNGENQVSINKSLFPKNKNSRYLPWGRFINTRSFSEFNFLDLSFQFPKCKSFFRDFVIDRGGIESKPPSPSISKLKLIRTYSASPYRVILLFHENG